MTGLYSETGEAITEYIYDAFGNQMNTNEADTNPFRYCGEYFDEETNNIYLRSRYYAPMIGRFISEDTHWNIDNMVYGDRADDQSESKLTYPSITSIKQSINLYAYCINNPQKYIDNSGEHAVIAGVALTAEAIPIIGTGIVVLGYLASKVFVNAFKSAIEAGKSIVDSIIYAKGKTKEPKPPSKLKNGDKVKTPDTHPDEFNKKSDGSYEHKKTKWVFKKDYSRHGGDHWDASPNGKTGNYINVNPNGTIR